MLYKQAMVQICSYCKKRVIWYNVYHSIVFNLAHMRRFKYEGISALYRLRIPQTIGAIVETLKVFLSKLHFLNSTFPIVLRSEAEIVLRTSRHVFVLIFSFYQNRGRHWEIFRKLRLIMYSPFFNTDVDLDMNFD